MRHRPALATALAVLTAFALSGCARSGTSPSAESTPGPAVEVTSPVTTLPSVEVKSYQGKPLSPIKDLHENSIKGPQQIDHATYRLKVGGLVNKPLSLSYDELLAIQPRFQKVVGLNCVEGWSVTFLWEGFRINDLLAKAGGVKPGAKVIVFHAHDGYTSSLPLDYLTSRNILLAYKENGVPLTAEWGWPLQLVAEQKWGYKWVKWIDGIEVSSDVNYRGYWEQRGYSNGGNLSDSYIAP
jgi:DMSO/TMAO reductase YedYZ molybdopterin-dependent catalytic subunit